MKKSRTIKARSIKVGDQIFTENNESVTVKKIMNGWPVGTIELQFANGWAAVVNSNANLFIAEEYQTED